MIRLNPKNRVAVQAAPCICCRSHLALLDSLMEKPITFTGAQSGAAVIRGPLFPWTAHTHRCKLAVT